MPDSTSFSARAAKSLVQLFLRHRYAYEGVPRVGRYVSRLELSLARLNVAEGLQKHGMYYGRYWIAMQVPGVAEFILVHAQCHLAIGASRASSARACKVYNFFISNVMPCVHGPLWRAASSAPRASALRPATHTHPQTLRSILRPPCHLISRNAAATPIRGASTEAAHARKKAVLYPERINVYRAGTSATLSVGLTRVATIIIFLAGATVYAPAYFFSPDHSSLWVPVYIAAAAVPFFVTALTTGPMIHAIRVYLPSRARRSKDDLKRFASLTPADTLLELQYMRWLPWPQTRRVPFGRLRRLQPSLRGGIANLEQQNPLVTDKLKNSLLGWLAHRNWGRFYVNRAQRNDRSAVPGVWEGMWGQIPLKGSKEDILMAQAESKKVKAPVQMRGRSPTTKDGKRREMKRLSLL
ncbi:uncharacterized protein MYCFIDRAFT_205954 [Pseudocercospora fijiensis CIRAD86]|uniref:Uncharacterized protein n=1 Tax=Pseudocercospora fijiensis (strain CIRAD86) TaxID=383855 RepID=N1QB23_PSEFD|nr:uncharacterized protein MYCFIDRAFT_205954 [Pseudocercospora fijiensis CIRAD86]EME88243.1 hypothetical protein MYCFIDRAFT_205954 [Pseudocercospora fijiensis CIRAD86]